MFLFGFQNSGRGFIFLWSLVWVPIFLWIIIRVEEHTVLSRFLCNVESFRSLYGFATKWKISSIINGRYSIFWLENFSCMNLEVFWCTLTELTFADNSPNVRLREFSCSIENPFGWFYLACVPFIHCGTSELISNMKALIW